MVDSATSLPLPIPLLNGVEQVLSPLEEADNNLQTGTNHPHLVAVSARPALLLVRMLIGERHEGPNLLHDPITDLVDSSEVEQEGSTVVDRPGSLEVVESRGINSRWG